MFAIILFNETPKTLDPARSYSTNEAVFTAQIYEPPLQYHYLKRPYTLIPLTLNKMPEMTYLDSHYNLLTNNQLSKNKIAYTLYNFSVKP